MIVSTDQIDKLCKKKCGVLPLITPYNPLDNENNPARAELHLGRKCYCSDSPKCVCNLEEKQKIEIAPNTIFLFETFERVNFPKNLSGRMSLKMGMIRQGLLMPNQTQVDPGYSNVLFGMLYNLSSSPVKLEYRQPITTLEVMETQESSRKYDGKMKAMTFEKYVSERVESSLGYLDRNLQASNEKLEESTKHLDKSVNLWNRSIGIITVIIAVITALVTIMSFQKDPDLQILQAQMEEIQTTVEEQRDLLADYSERIAQLEESVLP